MSRFDKLNEAQPAAFAGELIKSVREELRDNKGELSRLASISEGRFSHSWLIAFSSGKIKAPHSDMLLDLASYLGFRFKVEEGPHFNKFRP